MVFYGFINGFWLKIVMLILMVLDHIYYFLGMHEFAFIHAVTRVVAPVFAYLMAQGMVYTRSRERYILRLFSFAAVMWLGNIILLFITNIRIPNNIFLSLALGASIIYLTDKVKEGKDLPLYIALAAGAVIFSYYCEGGYIMPMSVVIFYLFRNNKPLMYAVYILLSGIPFLVAYVFTVELQTQFYMIFAVLPIMLYNGRRGPDNMFAKYFFYLFYPLHIWVIVLIKFSLQG